MQSSSGQRLVSGSTPVPIKEIHVLWITAGLGCDGDTIAMTAATQPSIEDILLGGIPWIPKVYMHNPFLTYDNGEEFMRHFHAAAEGKLAPFILVMEGSIPNEKNKSDGYWATFGTDQVSGQPILTCDWVDRLAPKAWAVVAAGTCATYGGIHAMEGNPTGCMGLADYLGWGWKSEAGIPIVCVPGCPVQPDNFMEVLLYLLHMAAGLRNGFRQRSLHAHFHLGASVIFNVFNCAISNLVLTRAATALRSSEILALRWSDVLWDEGRTRISKRWAKGEDGETKTDVSDGSSRYIGS